MARRLLMLGLVALVTAAPAAARTPPDPRTPEEAIAVIKRIVKRTVGVCKTDWVKIDVLGYRRNWKATVKIRSSLAGDGPARWRIGKGWPVATNTLAKALARGCPDD